MYVCTNAIFQCGQYVLGSEMTLVLFVEEMKSMLRQLVYRVTMPTYTPLQ